MKMILLFVFVILSVVNLSSSQSDSPRNLETFFPFSIIPPPSPSDPSPPATSPEFIQIVPPATPRDRNSPPSRSSKKGVVTAVAATAASAFVLAAVFFLLFTKLSQKRRRNETSVSGEGSEGRPAVVSAAAESRSDFKRFDGEVKGYVVDEDGLDVLYWNKLNSTAFNTAERFPSSPPNSSGGGSAFNTAERSSSSPQNRSIRSVSFKDTVESIPAVPPPPPPPPPASRPAAPPPRPPPGGSRTKESAAIAKASDQVKMKPLHWEKVNINREQSNVWDKIESGSFQYNGDMMEALFGVAATNRKPFSDSYNGDESGSNKARIFILDQRKSQNVAIVVKSLGIPREELIASLQEGKGLSAETLEKLSRTAPTEEEATKILAFNDDPSKLAHAEFFLYTLLKSVPSAFTRANEMLFRSNYGSEIVGLKESLNTLESACNDLRNRGIFLKLLEAILKAGNRLNAGTARGNAKAFDLTTLRKLSDYKSSDGKTTLLHFVIHEVIRNEGKRGVLMRSSSMGRQQDDQAGMDDREKEYLKLGLPVVGGLSSEFSNVKKAANIDYDTLKNTLGSIATRVRDASVGDGDGGFQKEMRDFLVSAKVEIKEVEDEHVRVMELVKKTTHYYQAKASNDRNPLQLFVIVKDFLGMVDQACVEIARSVQQKKQTKPESGSGSGSTRTGALRNRVTFPKLPKNFMSDKSSDDES